MNATERTESNRALAIFFALAVAFAAVFDYLAIHYRAGTYNLMWSVAIATLLTLRLTRRDLASLGWGWGESRWPLLAYALPIAYLAVAYAIVWALGLGGFYNHDTVNQWKQGIGAPGWSDGAMIVYRLLTVGTLGIFGSLSSALGEEIGWRGFLVPELAKRWSFATVALVSSAIWAAWHLPLILLGNYHNSSADFPLVYQLLCFFTIVLSAGIVLAYLRLRSGSLWPAAILHASHNLWLQAIFNPLTEMKPGTAKFIDELGIVPPLVVLPIALYFLRRGQRELGRP